MQSNQFTKQNPAERNEPFESDQLNFRIGDECIWNNNGTEEKCVIKFIGFLKGRKSLYAGVEWRNPIGAGTGVFDREQLFLAEDGYAHFVELSWLIKAKNERYSKVEAENSSLDKMFLPSEKNDAILVVEKQKLHVNKAFLTYHSDYFRALFSTNFKECQLQEIPIKDITVDEFKLVLSTIHPETVIPVNDKTVEKLLELADRFMIPAVLKPAEIHLQTNSKIENSTMLWLADKYRMIKLLDVCILRIDTVAKAKKLQLSPHFHEISDETNAKLFKRLLNII